MNKIKAIIHTVVIIAIYFLMDALSTEVLGFAFAESDSLILGEVAFVSSDITCTIFAVYLYSKFVLKKKLSEIYLGRPLPSVKWCAMAFLMPVAIVVFYIVFTKGAFYREKLIWEDMIYAVCYSVLGVGLDAAITQEIIFRGMIPSILQKSWGAKSTIFISSALFIIPYLGNIDTEVKGDVFRLSLAIMLVGAALSLVVYESGSVWSSVVIHVMYNILSGGTLIFHMGTERDLSAIWNYTFESDHVLLTGVRGSNELDTGLPAMAGFLAIIVLAAYFIKKRGTGIRYAGAPGQEPQKYI